MPWVGFNEGVSVNNPFLSHTTQHTTHLDGVPNHRRVVVDVAAQLDLHQVPGLERFLSSHRRGYDEAANKNRARSQ